MDMNLLTIFVISLFLIVVYISKTNRNNHIKVLYVASGMAFVILMMIPLYKEQVLEKGNFTNFAVMSLILSGLVALEGLEIFELLPDFTEKPKEA
ncbi:MAG: hypothetical protein WC788_07110 [Candidatus Paceibacterota bacterium]|jgi:hypothetical protein